MGDFLKELTRRKVIRVAAAYGIVGWIILQAVGLIAPNIGLPVWTVGLVLVLLLAGLPLAMLFTWAFEITPDGVKRTVPGTPGNEKISQLDLALLAVLLVVGTISVFGIATRKPEASDNVATTEPVEVKPSRLAIAVLPFVDMSPEGDQDWFSDGISEEIIHRLVQQKQLTVAGRTSSFYFKGKNVPFREIGALLNVGTVLEGSVRKFENRIRITAQLIDIESGAHRWSGTFDRELNDIFKIQDELSVAIAAELLREMGLEATPAKTRAYQPMLAAYEVYLQARQLRRVPTPEATNEAMRLLRLAAELDPDYADPIIGIVEVLAYNARTYLLEGDQFDVEALVRQASARTLEPAQEAFLQANAAIYDWRYIEAERHYREYVRLTDTIQARWGLGVLLASTGRGEEAVPYIEEALARSPFNGMMRLWMTYAYNVAGRYNDTLKFIEKSDLSGMPAPDVIAFNGLVAAFALGDREALNSLSGRAPILFGLDWVEYYSVLMDANPVAIKALQAELKAPYDKTSLGDRAASIAELSQAVGDSENALKWMAVAIEEKAWGARELLSYRSRPFVQFLLSSPEGRALIVKAGFDIAWLEEPIEGARVK